MEIELKQLTKANLKKRKRGKRSYGDGAEQVAGGESGVSVTFLHGRVISASEKRDRHD